MFGLILKGLFVLLEEIKKGVVYLSDFLRIIVFPAHPLLKHMGVKGGFGGTQAKSDDRLRTQKTEEQMCGAKSPTFSQPHIDPHREIPLRVFNVGLVSIRMLLCEEI